MRDTMHDHDNPFATRLRATSADRRTFIGASDAATVLGLSPWSTEMALWLRMTSTELQTPDNNATKRGRYLERGLLDWAADELQATSVVEGIPIDEPGIEGPEPWMAFHPDGALRLQDVWRLAEVKTSRNAHEWGEGDDIPMHILVQVQYQLACLGDVDEVVVVAYLPIADRLSLHTIARDDAFGRLLVDKLGAWYWRHVVKLQPPELDASKASTEYLRRLHPKQRGPLRVATPDEAQLVQAFADARAEVRAAKARVELLGNRLRGVIGDADAIRSGAGKVTWRATSGSDTIDADKLRRVYPDVWQRVVRQGDDRRDLRFTPAR
jgi:putative phage-type endonuclease